MNKDQIQLEVIEILSIILKHEVGFNAKRTDLETWDSLKHIDIIFALEDKFGVEFEADEMNDMVTVIDIASIISEKMKSTK